MIPVIAKLARPIMWLVNGSARSARWTTASWPSARGRQHLVPDDQSPLSSVASSGRVAPCSGRPGGDRAPVGLRNWVEQGYKQVKQELGWADFMVRSDRAIRRHWQLVCCAFCFCWRAWFAEEATAPLPPDAQPAPADARGEGARRHGRQARHRRVAAGAAPGARLAWPVGRAGALLAGVVDQAPTSPAGAAA